MSDIARARREVEEVYTANNLTQIMSVLEIIDKYTSVSSKELIDVPVDEMQSDAIKLCAFNFYLSTLSANLNADFAQASNQRKYQEASIWNQLKRQEPSKKLGELDKEAEEAITKFRDTEIECQRKAKIMEAAVLSVIEVVNILKKAVEKKLWEGQHSNL